MQDCRALLTSLRERGIRLWIENEQLRFQAPAGALLPELRDELRRLREEIIDALRSENAGTEEVPFEPRPADYPIPLTAMQRRRWNNRLTEKRYRLRTSIVANRIVGEFNFSWLKVSLGILIERHESLRTHIVEIDGVPWQKVVPPHAAEVEFIDLAGLPERDREMHLASLVDAFLGEEIDFCVGPLFSSKLFRLSAEQHLCVVALNHLISDGVSDELIRNELWTLYEQLSLGRALSLPPLSLQFADYAVWQQRTRNDWMKQHERYWIDRLSDAPIVRLPVDGNLSGVPQAAMRRITFGATLSAELRKLAQQQRCLVSLVILTLYATMVSQWCGQRDLVTRLITSSRYRPELNNMVGFIASHLYLRIQLRDEHRFIDSLKQVQHEFHSAFDHLDFDRVPELLPECHATELCFNWAPEFRWSFERPDKQVGRLTLKSFECHPPRILNLMPFLYDDEHEIAGWIEYRGDRFSPETIEYIETELRRMAAVCVRDPTASLTSI